MLLLYVAVGGAFGALLRYLVTGGIYGLMGRAFPYGTLAVNVLGAFLLGIALGVISGMEPRGAELYRLLVVGALSSFTSFSFYVLDGWLLFERGMPVQAAAYLGGSLALSFGAFFLGMCVYKWLAV